MNVHAIIHAATEGLGTIADWASARGHTVTETHPYRGEVLPPLNDVDFVVIMGGAMNVNQHRDFPWLVPEKRWVAEAIAQGKKVLGVCLGAQLIADVLGAKVYQNAEKEIGWLPVRLLARPGPFADFPEQATVFHWHGDTFDLPQGAVHVAESEGCANQAFLFGDRVVGLQFHLEVAPESVEPFITGGDGEFKAARFVQTREEILAPPSDFPARALDGLLEALAESNGNPGWRLTLAD